jgi:hypothetical protein
VEPGVRELVEVGLQELRVARHLVDLGLALLHVVERVVGPQVRHLVLVAGNRRQGDAPGAQLRVGDARVDLRQRLDERGALPLVRGHLSGLDLLAHDQHEVGRRRRCLLRRGL